MSSLHLYDFGIFLELAPDEEEKALLENNIQAALAQQSIELEDAIDLRNLKNIKVANQLLKIRRQKKQEKDQQMQQENMQAQAQANAQAQQAAAQAEVMKNQAITQNTIQIEEAKTQFEQNTNTQEFELKKALMDHEFQLNLQLKQMDIDSINKKEKVKEDRKDERTRIQATQQSDLIEQRKTGKPPKNFESVGNDILEGDFGLDAFNL